MSGMGPRRNSTMELFQEGQDADIEYFFASDASAIIEHTNRVIYLEVRGSFKIVTGCRFFNSSICKPVFSALVQDIQKRIFVSCFPPSISRK